MKQNLLLVAIVAISVNINAQYFADTSLNSMVKAEFDFALMAKEQNTRAAFLAYCNDESIGFDNVRGSMIKHWQEVKPDSSLLAWKPDYADISMAGDVGFDAGPCQYYKNRKSTIPTSIGHFITFWQRDKAGRWKVALDMGISYKGTQNLELLEKSQVDMTNLSTWSESSILSAEQALMSALESNSVNAYFNFLSSEVRLYYNDYEPVINEVAVKEFLRIYPNKITFNFVDKIVSQSADMAATYGTATIEVVENTKIVSKKGKYLRFWKKEDGRNWKLVVQAVSFE